MDNEISKIIDFEKERKRLSIRAFLFTGLYCALVALLFLFGPFERKGVDAFLNMEPNAIGDLLAGVAAPLALIWLVFGYFLQGVAIRQQGEELRLQRASLEAQVEELRKSVLHQGEMVLATKQQAMSQLELMRPVLAIKSFSWANESTLIVIVHNSGAPAFNLSATCGLGQHEKPKSRISFLQRDGAIEFYFENVPRPWSWSLPSISECGAGLAVVFDFEFGNGLSGAETFEYIQDEPKKVGRFMNRKAIQQSVEIS